MNEQLDKYFLGELSDTEKKDLFDQIESSPEKKAEFIRMQNTVTISKLGEQNGDDKSHQPETGPPALSQSGKICRCRSHLTD